MGYSSTKLPIKAFILSDFFSVGAECTFFLFFFQITKFSVLLEENQNYLDENMR